MTANKPANRRRRTNCNAAEAWTLDFAAFLVFFVPLWFIDIVL
jgi:hypothetical protein